MGLLTSIADNIVLVSWFIAAAAVMFVLAATYRVSRSTSIEPQFDEELFEAFENIADRLQLSKADGDGQLPVPELTGTLRGLQLDVRLQPRDPDQESPPDRAVDYQVTIDVDVPFPWSGFVVEVDWPDPSAPRKQREPDIVLSPGFSLSSTKRIGDIELSEYTEDVFLHLARHCPQMAIEDERLCCPLQLPDGPPERLTTTLSQSIDDITAIVERLAKQEARFVLDEIPGDLSVVARISSTRTVEGLHRPRLILETGPISGWPEDLEVTSRPAYSGKGVDDSPSTEPRKFDAWFDTDGRRLDSTGLPDEELQFELVALLDRFETVELDNQHLQVEETILAPDAAAHFDESIELAGGAAFEIQSLL